MELYQEEVRGGRERERYVNNNIGEHVSVIMRIGGKLCRCK